MSILMMSVITVGLCGVTWLGLVLDDGSRTQ